MSSRNGFAEAARAKKVAALVEYFDGSACKHSLNPHSAETAAFLVDALNNLSTGDWARAAIICGQRPPSADSIAMVVATYEQRAAVARVA